MFGIRYFKADSSTFVIKTVNGQVRKSGKGLSFFYNAAATSIATIPMNAQEAPFIFALQTSDFQNIKVQGQISYRVAEPIKAAETLNFNLKKNGLDYASDDPRNLNDRVVRSVQSLVQSRVQEKSLKAALLINQSLAKLIKDELGLASSLLDLGLVVMDATISAITPTPETARALEAEARENILKEADDAIYNRRKFAVEQERKIKEAELQTQLSVQQKQQEIEESRIANERSLLKGEVETAKEKLLAEIHAEEQRKALVQLSSENEKLEAESEAYAIQSRMKALSALPVENLKALAQSNMTPEQMMALAFDNLASNSNKIGELNITPDLFGQFVKKARAC